MSGIFQAVPGSTYRVGSDAAGGQSKGQFMDLQVIRVRVALVRVIAEHDARAFRPHDRHDPTEHLVDRGIDERLWSCVVDRPGHPRVAIAETNDAVVSDDLRCSLQLAYSDLPQSLDNAGPIHRGVENVPGFAAGGAYQHTPCSPVRETRHRGRSLRALVVGMCMNRECCGHGRGVSHAIGTRSASGREHCRSRQPLVT